MLAELLNFRRSPRRESRATLENPSVPLSADSWEAAGWSGGTTDSGITITPETALTYAPVWAAVNLISGAIAKLPLNIYKRLPDAGENAREKDAEHAAHKLISRQANREKTAFDFWRTIMVHNLIWNRAYAYIDQDSPGEPRELFNLLPDRTNAERLRGADVYSATNDAGLASELDGQLVYVTESGGRLKTLFPSQVLHFKGISPDGIDGCELVNKARNSWALGLARRRFSSKFFKNGARVGGTLVLPAAMGKQGRDKLEESFRKSYEDGDNPFKVIVMREGGAFHAGQTSPEQAQLTQATLEDVREVCLWYKLQPSKLGLSDSVSYNSKAEDNQAFLDDTLSDWLAMITAECWMKLLTPKQQKKDSHFFEHNTKALLRMDTLKRFQVYQISLAARIQNRNEIRALENLLPVEGGDEFDPQPGQTTGFGENPTESDGNEEDSPPKKTESDKKKPGSDEKKAAFRRWIFDITARGRHKSRKPAAFCEWLDAGLVAHRESAEQESLDGAVELLAPLIESLNAVVQIHNADTLPAAVDAILSAFEQEYGA